MHITLFSDLEVKKPKKTPPTVCAKAWFKPDFFFLEFVQYKRQNMRLIFPSSHDTVGHSHVQFIEVMENQELLFYYLLEEQHQQGKSVKCCTEHPSS